MISSRAVALQGIGFAALLVAVQGLAPVQQPAVAQETVVVHRAGGGHYDAGQAYVRKDHGWVKATKFGISGGKPFDISILQKSIAQIEQPAGVPVRALPAVADSKNAASISYTSTLALAYTQDTAMHSSASVSRAKFGARSQAMDREWLSADELLVILEAMT